MTMTMETFKTSLIDSLGMKVSSGDRISFESVENGRAEGITIIPEGKEADFYPVVSLAGFYEEYLRTNDIDCVSSNLIDLFAELWGSIPEHPCSVNALKMLS